MIDLITTNLGAIRKACDDHNVKSLWVFGSAVNGNWVEATSDIDFLAELGETETSWFNKLPGLDSVPEDAVGMRIDLVEIRDVRSELLAQELTMSKVQVFERVLKEVST